MDDVKIIKPINSEDSMPYVIYNDGTKHPVKLVNKYGHKDIIDKIESDDMKGILSKIIKAKRPPIELYSNRNTNFSTIIKEEITMTVEEKIKTAKEIASTATELAELLAKNGSDNYTEALENDMFNNITALIGR